MSAREIPDNGRINGNVLREEALERLKKAVDIGAENGRWKVGNTLVPKTEIDTLLEDLEQNRSYLHIPMALLFGDEFWRKLKISSNQGEIEQER